MEKKQYTVKTRCKFCRREFDSFNLMKVCNDCDRRMDEHFAVIREYIYANPEANMGEICEALDVPSALIKYYLKEERLKIKEGKNIFLRCEGCGQPISSGRYCRDCEIGVARTKLAGKLGSVGDNDQMYKDIAMFHSRSTKRGKLTLPKDK